MCRVLLSVAVLAALSACSAEHKEQHGVDAGTSRDAGVVSAGDDRLRQSDLRGARAGFEADLQANPQDPHAAFGAALSRTLLLPDHPALVQFFDGCAQPHVDAANQLFGPSGLLTRDRDARAGSGTIRVARKANNGALTTVGFRIDSLRTTVVREGEERRLVMKAQDAAYEGGRHAASLELRVSYSEPSTTPGLGLMNGLEIAASDFRGTITFSLPSADGLIWDTFTTPLAGSLVFQTVGTGASGDAITVEMKDLYLEGRPSSCGATCPSEWPELMLDGTLVDTVTAAATLSLPFQTVESDPGPPHRDALVVLIEKCPGLSMEQLRQVGLAMLAELGEIHGLLDVVLKSPSAEAFQFQVPGGLFFVEGAIPLNVTDARVFRTVVSTLLALGHGSSQYRTLSKKFDELIGGYQRWLDTSPLPPTAREERGFVVRALVKDLNDTFLGRQPGFELASARTWLLQALDDATKAVSLEPKNAGVFNFQTANSKEFAADLKAQLDFLRASVEQAEPQPFPHSPDFRLSLRTAFETPVDLTALHAASKDGAGVFLLRPGDPQSPAAFERNDALDVDLEAVTQAFAPVLHLPADLSEQVCDPALFCPGRYRCVADGPTTPRGHCQTPDFAFMDKAAIERALPSSGDPAFFDVDALLPLQVLFE